MTVRFLIFYGVFFTVYGLVNAYIFVRGWQAIPRESSFRRIYPLVFAFLAASFMGGRLLENVWLSPVSQGLIRIGSFWFAGMLYFFLALLLLDFLRVIHRAVPFFPDFLLRDYAQTKRRTALLVTAAVGIVLFLGHLNALDPRVKTLNLSISKSVPTVQSLRIVIASDIHLGTIIGRERFARIVSMINERDPDLVLLPGDILDEDPAPVIHDHVGDLLKAIRSRYGVWAITGNHEYIGGAEVACRYLADHGVSVLRDQTARIGDFLQLVGREDRSMERFTGKTRKPLEELMRDVDRHLPVILMDHQPFGLEEAVRNGADLQLSGHTHHGQMWPLNLVTSLLYEVSWGYLRKGNTHVYVSSGVGTWGPPVRVGNRPEIVEITLRFQ